MNLLLQKEVRMVLPVWLLAMALAVLPIWLLWPGPHGLVPPEPGFLVFAPFAAGVLLLGITPFGQELGTGMFPALLAQPVPRGRIWAVKTAVLAIALVTVFLAFCVSSYVRVDALLESMKTTVWHNVFTRPVPPAQFVKLIDETRRAAFQDSAVFGGLAVMAAFAGGLWTTLFFRQISAAFWFSILIPLGLALLTVKVLGGYSDLAVEAGLIVAVGCYSAAGYLGARRLFREAQDTQWTGGIVALPAWGSRAVTGPAARPKRQIIRSLVRKEFQANHINLLLAAGLLVLHIAVLAFRRLGLDYVSAHTSLAMVLESFPVLWLAMPLMVGSIAVAEERKLGMMETALCLPATRRLQFIVKFLVALLLGVVLGAAVPLTLEWIGTLAGLRANPGMAVQYEIWSSVTVCKVGSVGILFLAFYASTLTRNTLQAMGVGLMSSLIAFALIVAVMHSENLGAGYLWSPRLAAWTAVPVMVLLLLLLSYSNYKRLHPGASVWRRNLFAIVATLVGAAGVATTVYHRAWEAWLPVEPPHVLSPSYFAGGFKVPPKLSATAFRMAAILPDGRLWLRQAPTRTIEFRNPNLRYPILGEQQVGPWRSGFVSGSDWRDVALAQGGGFGLKQDGTLWDLSGVKIEANRVYSEPKPFGAAGEWKSIAAGGRHFTAIKADGTLWEWGECFTRSNNRVILNHLSLPRQVGTDSDWVAVCDSDQTSAAVKADGSIWRWGHLSIRQGDFSWTDRVAEGPERWLVLPGGQPVSLALRDRMIAIVCADGTLWLGGGLPAGMVSQDQARLALSTLVRWDNSSDWREVDFVRWQGLVALKRGGPLCEWDPSKLLRRTVDWAVPPMLPSQYMDWVTACAYQNAFLALAGDGTLCLWGDPQDDGYLSFYGPDPRKLLLPSRIKARKIDEIPLTPPPTR